MQHLPQLLLRSSACLLSWLTLQAGNASFVAADDRLRLIIETDAGGDPDDEQSLVRFLVYANEFDVTGIIANRPQARDGENKNPVRDGLGIVRRMLDGYAACYPNLRRHDRNYPAPDELRARTVAGYNDIDEGVELIIRAVDADDPRPVWFSNWGTDNGAAVSCLKRALDRVWAERGPDGYAAFKQRIYLSSADKFGEHTSTRSPPFPFWLDASHPPLEGQRWYHRFSALTATAGDFDIERDVRQNHGPLGAMYPVNTGLPQKEGDTMMFLYLLPTGMNHPLQPTWGSWGGRYGLNPDYPNRGYYWANQADQWNGTRHRDHTVARWAADLQRDFAARLDWCVSREYEHANHHPLAVLNGDTSRDILQVTARTGDTIRLAATSSSDPDGDDLQYRWFVYPEAGTYAGHLELQRQSGNETSLVAPAVTQTATLHVLLQVRDNGSPSLVSYRRLVATIEP